MTYKELKAFKVIRSGGRIVEIEKSSGLLEWLHITSKMHNDNAQHVDICGVDLIKALHAELGNLLLAVKDREKDLIDSIAILPYSEIDKKIWKFLRDGAKNVNPIHEWVRDEMPQALPDGKITTSV